MIFDKKNLCEPNDFLSIKRLVCHFEQYLRNFVVKQYFLYNLGLCFLSGIVNAGFTFVDNAFVSHGNLMFSIFLNFCEMQLDDLKSLLTYIILILFCIYLVP